MFKFDPNQFVEYSFKNFLLNFIYTKFNAILYYLKYIRPNKKILKKTISLKNLKKGKKAFIFGSGPSMNELDPKKISHYVNDEQFEVIALNSFLYSDFSNFVTPNYMVFSDPVDFTSVPEDHVNYSRSVNGQKDKKRAIEKNIPLIVPINFLEQTKKGHGQVFYFNDCSDFFSKKIDLLKPRPYKTFTGLKAIACGVYMGYDEIYICGFDYDNFKKTYVNEDNEIIHEFNHYYDSKDRPSRVINVQKSFGHHLHSGALAFIHHDKFKRFNIINLHKNSFIDSFPKNKNLNVYI